MPALYRHMASLALVLVLIAGWMSLEAHGQTSMVIEQIVVEGNQRIEPETIAGYMTIQAGDEFDVRRTDESLKSLFATGLFCRYQYPARRQ